LDSEFDIPGQNSSESRFDNRQWQDVIHLLKLSQGDYQTIRRHLGEMDNNLAERENLINQRLQYAFQMVQGYHTLCLTSYATKGATNRIGSVVLGELPETTDLPGTNYLEIYCLGKFEIRSSWKKVERWKSVKGKTVLQYIITRDSKPVQKEVLMEVLWPECDPQSANNNLKAAIHGLRNTLGELFESKESGPLVLFEQGSYLLDPGIKVWVDVSEFEKHWLQGQALEKQGKYDSAMEEYKAADELYRGDYMEDEPYQEWTLFNREALKDVNLLILAKLANHSILNEDFDSCITYSQKILAKDPCREDAYRRLMRCHSKLGQRNRALRWYEICCQTIRNELDTEPDTKTSELYLQLLHDKPID